jgi:hypothetical protein
VTLSLNISPEIEAKLRQQAAVSGEPLEVYAAKVLAQAIVAPTIDELLAPVRNEAIASGMSEDELMNFGHELLRKTREDKQGK